MDSSTATATSASATAKPAVTAGPATPIEAIPSIVSDVRAAFERGTSRPAAWRDRQLRAMSALLRERQDDICDALHADLGKPRLEAWTAEIRHLEGAVSLLRKSFRSWMRPERVATSLVAQPGSSRIHREPLGVVLVISPWNFPFGLAFEPMAGAIAAGNCVVVKPSEVAPATSALLARVLPQYLDPECVKVVQGGVPETTELLAQRFDHIFYTGNGTIGRVVMQAATKHLTPVTLELGGKSPCIVDAKVDLDVAARRIAWAKFYNAGQICVAPDYVLADARIHDALLDKLSATVREFWGDDPQQSKDYGRIVNARHHARLLKLLDGQTIVVGGKADEADRYLAPTILRDVAPGSAVMADEIFGPILPVLKVGGIDEAIGFVNARPKPLALYVFSGDSDVPRRVIDRTSSGSAVVNHCFMQLAVPSLPFGGVGESGMGAYHGRQSFETFTHRKSVLSKPTMIDPTFVYPPYTDSKEAWIRRLM